jgi:excisionase family DNA binding protein
MPLGPVLRPWRLLSDCRRDGLGSNAVRIGMTTNIAQLPEPDLLSQAEVGRRLGVSRTTVWRLVRDGQLPIVHIGARTLVPRSAVETFIDGRTESMAP